MDVGLTSYFLTYVPPREIALETPAFATLGNGEVDFYVKSLRTQKTYAIEVKSGKNSSKTIKAVLDRKKVGYVVFAKFKCSEARTFASHINIQISVTDKSVRQSNFFCSEIQENLDFGKINFVKIRQNLRNRLILGGGVEVTIRQEMDGR